MSVKSTDCGTLWLTDSGVFPESESTMKLVVMPRKAKEILELVGRYQADDLRMRAIVNDSDVERLARELGFDIGSGVVRMSQGMVILVRRADQYLIKEDFSLPSRLEHFTFSVLVGA